MGDGELVHAVGRGELLGLAGLQLAAEADVLAERQLEGLERFLGAAEAHLETFRRHDLDGVAGGAGIGGRRHEPRLGDGFTALFVGLVDLRCLGLAGNLLGERLDQGGDTTFGGLAVGELLHCGGSVGVVEGDELGGGGGGDVQHG